MLALLLLLGCPSSEPAPSPAEETVKELSVRWSIVHNASFETDHGDGVTRETGSSERYVSRSGVYELSTGWNESMGADAPESPATRTDLPPLSAERLAKIEALLPKLEALGETGDPAFGLRYSLSQYVDDEGGSWEGLAVTIGERTFSIALEQGRQSPYPPAVVVQLYELVTGGKAPAPWK